MNLKINTCCCCINLRIGCIVIAIVGVILAIVGVSIKTGWASILGLIIALFANACMLYAAVYINGSNRSRMIAVMVYIIFSLVSALFLFIGSIILCVNWTSGNWNSSGHASFATALLVRIINIILDLYFALVAFSFYQELNGESVSIEGHV